MLKVKGWLNRYKIWSYGSRKNSFGKHIVLIFLIFCSFSLYSEVNDLRISENHYFEIVGSDAKSTHYINQLSNYVANYILGDFNENNYFPPRKVLIILSERDDAIEADKHYQCNMSGLGFVTLEIFWSKTLTLPITIEALVLSFLQSYCYATYGHEFLEKITTNAWMLDGLSNNIYLSLRPICCQ